LARISQRPAALRDFNPANVSFGSMLLKKGLVKIGEQ
jgi:hypothetical protein